MSLISNQLDKFVLQSMARKLLPKERVALCLRLPQSLRQDVEVYYASLSRSAHYAKLQTCGSLWHCPVCASKISERKRLELQPFVDNWADWFGGQVLFVTFTMRHKKNEPFSQVLGEAKRKLKTGLKGAIWHFHSGEGVQLFHERFQVVGSVTALEVTHGANGWHPHPHQLYFTHRPIDIALFTHEMKLRWRNSLFFVGRSASYERGADVRYVDGYAPSYLTKMGLVADVQADELAREVGHWTAAHELAKATSKLGRNGSRSMLQLLRLAADGDDEAAKLWQEYAIVIKGSNHLRWSPGLRNFLGLGAQRTDKELVDQVTQTAILLAQIEYDQWQQVLQQELRGPLLQVASAGDVAALQQWLTEHGINGVKFPDNINLHLDLQEDLNND